MTEERGRLMALDIGRRRIGVALSDPTRTLARSLQVIQSRSRETDMKVIMSLAVEHGVTKIIVGHPRRLDGTVGEEARQIEAYAEELEAMAEIPVVLWDEAFSTVRAREVMIEAGTKRRERRTRVDAVAAAVILQDYLDSMSWKSK